MNTTCLHRRRALAAVAQLAAASLAPFVPGAQAQGTDGPLVTAPKILESLTDKDIVLDRPGARRDPSIDLQVPFAFDSAHLLPQGQRQLDELAMALSNQALADWAFVLAGHTDGVGDADYNLRLSMARAETVKAYLVQAHGIAPGRLQSIGYGYTRLRDPANPAAAVNRRVEVRRVALAAAAAPAPRPAPGGRLVPTPQ